MCIYTYMQLCIYICIIRETLPLKLSSVDISEFQMPPFRAMTWPKATSIGIPTEFSKSTHSVPAVGLLGLLGLWAL